MKGKHLTELDHHLQYEHLQELHNRSFLETYQLNRQLNFHIYFAIEFGLFQTHQPHMHQLRSKLHLLVRQIIHPN